MTSSGAGWYTADGLVSWRWYLGTVTGLEFRRKDFNLLANSFALPVRFILRLSWLKAAAPLWVIVWRDFAVLLRGSIRFPAADARVPPATGAANFAWRLAGIPVTIVCCIILEVQNSKSWG